MQLAQSLTLLTESKENYRIKGKLGLWFTHENENR